MWLLNILIKLISKSLEEDQVGNSLLMRIIHIITSIVLFVKHYKGGGSLPLGSKPFSHTVTFPDIKDKKPEAIFTKLA